MVFSIPSLKAYQIDKRKIGMIIYELNTLALNSNSILIESSVVLDTDSFEEYQKNRVLSDKTVQDCILQLKKHGFEQVDMSISVFKECMMEKRPIVASVSYTTIYNAIILLYERWFDLKSAAKRITLRLDPSETFPAILIQPHRDVVLNTITRHPKTGKLLHSGDGSSIVHCSKPILDENEEEMIRAVDMIIVPPRKISYIQGYDGKCIIRSTETYPMTTEAKVNNVLEKYMNGSLSKLKAVSLIFPEDITTIDGYRYILSSKIRYTGHNVSVDSPVIGEAVFQWTRNSRITEKSVFLSDGFSPDDVESVKKSAGAIFTHYGGRTSHEAVLCRGLGIPCINGASDLFIDWSNEMAYTSHGETIREGDKICLLRSQWSVGGSITNNNTLKATISENAMEAICELINSFSDPQILGSLPIDLQFHISNLIRALRNSGWLH